MEVNDIIIHESIRMEAYKNLSLCFKYPDQTLLPTLEHLLKLFETMDSRALIYIADMTEAIQQHELSEIELDFSRLFIGPYTVLAPPYGSVYLEDNRRVMGESTIDAIRHYRESGLVIKETFYDIPDHVSVEMEFIYYLIFHEIKAIKEDKPDEAIDYFKKQVMFLNDHFSAWFFKFADSVESNAETDFYKKLAQACKAFIEEEVSEILSLEDDTAPTINGTMHNLG